MTRRSFAVRAALATLVVALLVAACGSSTPSAAPGSPSASGAPGGSAAPGQSGTPTASGAIPSGAATGAPTATAAPSTEPEESMPPMTEAPTAAPATLTAVADLEAMLPDELGGFELVKHSYTGTDMMQNTTAEQAKPLLDWLDALGKKPADFAQATAGDANGELKAFLVAYRIKGTPSAKFLSTFIDAVTASLTDGVTKGKATLGGKDVATFVINGQESFGTNYYYARDDVLFLVQTPDEALATEALSKLP